MTTTVTINRGEACAIPIQSITDAGNGLIGKRVTWALSTLLNGPRHLRKVSGLGASSADITIAVQTAGLIQGTVNMLAADFAQLPYDQYYATLWIDDGAGNDRCVTAGGYDLLVIQKDVSRSP